jgi:hypothetical protein
MIPAINAVEKQLELKYGIRERFPMIEIELPLHFISNKASIRLNPARVVYSLGGPGAYDSFFANLGVAHAHETGHLLSFFSAEGTLRYRNLARSREVDLGFLARRGFIPFHYLTGVDFSLFPIGLLKGYKGNDAYYWLNELIAHRVEEKVVGMENDRPAIAQNVQHALSEINPWIRVFHLALADVFGLKAGAVDLARSLRGKHLPWRRWLSTNDLRERMAQFYRAVELIYFLPH